MSPPPAPRQDNRRAYDSLRASLARDSVNLLGDAKGAIDEVGLGRVLACDMRSSGAHACVLIHSHCAGACACMGGMAMLLLGLRRLMHMWMQRPPHSKA